MILPAKLVYPYGYTNVAGKIIAKHTQKNHEYNYWYIHIGVILGFPIATHLWTACVNASHETIRVIDKLN